MGDITRQQAIYYLKAMRTMCVFQDAFGEPVDTDVYDEALDMAINSLEVDEAYNLMYESMRPTTPEEKASIRKHLDEISEPTGININDLYSDHQLECEKMKPAKWQQINKNEANVIPEWKCSNCGTEFQCHDMDFEYCPHCGALMEDDDD